MTRWPYIKQSPLWPVWMLFAAAALLLSTAHSGTVRILDTANVVRFEWSGTNAQVSADGQTWADYDATIYSKPVLLCGSNTAAGFLRGSNAVARVEILTNQVQGLNFIGTDYLRAVRLTNQPPLPP